MANGKIVELKPVRPPLHIACYGGAGARKSTFFATMPQPIVVGCFDAVGKDTPYWDLGEVQPPLVKKGLTYRQVLGPKGELVARIEYYHDPLIESPTAAALFMERVNRLGDEAKAGDLATFCLETVTSSSLTTRKMYQYDLLPGARDPRKWYGGAVDILEEILMVQLPALTCNVAIGLHMSKTKVESEQTKESGAVQLVRAPLLPGRLMESFSTQWPEIYRAYIGRDEEGKKIGLLQTRTDERYEAASQIRAPDPCLGTYAALWEPWDRRQARRRERAAKSG
jgi:BarA-like signal transduction histidine kinase